MANTLGGDYNFQVDPKMLEELEKQKILQQIQSGNIEYPELKSEMLDQASAMEEADIERWGQGKADVGQIERELMSRRGDDTARFDLAPDEYSDKALKDWYKSPQRDLNEPFGPQTPGIAPMEKPEFFSAMGPPDKLGKQGSPSPDIAQDARPAQKTRDDVLEEYKQNLMKKIASSQGRLDEAGAAFDKSQKAGGGWQGGLAKGLAVLGDTFSGFAGKKGTAASTVMGMIGKEKKEGRKAYDASIKKEGGYLKDLHGLESKEFENMKAKNLKDSLDPQSEESEAARLFAKKIYGIDLPATMNAVMAEKYMNIYAKKAKVDSVEDWKQKNYDQREKTLTEKPSEFGKVTGKKQAERYAETQEAIPKIARNIDKLDRAWDQQLKYSRESTGGTGPIATGFGLSKYASADTQSLEATYRDINLKNMVTTFSGMSKAVDSDAERKAWESTQPAIENDDPVNVKILLGMKSSLLKDKAVAEAQTAFAAKNGNLNGFEQSNPILRGEVTTMVDKNGEMQLVPKNQVAAVEKRGMKSLDNYADQVIKADYNAPAKAAGVAAPIPIGTVKNGYRFTGGNPNDQSSWEKE